MDMISLIKQLRRRTGLGLKECVDALKASDGDLEMAAISVRGTYSAPSHRMGTNRQIAYSVKKLDSNSLEYTIVDVRTETDFGAKCQEMTDFARQVVATPLFADDLLRQISLRLKEAVSINRLETKLVAASHYGAYLHHDSKSLGLVFFTQAVEPIIAQSVAMHIVAAVPQPIVVCPEEVGAKLLVEEEQFLRKKAAGKPEAIASKIVEGGLKKYKESLALLTQPFIRDPKQKVADILPIGSVRTFECWKI